MLRIDKVETISGVTVYGDSEAVQKFYVVADTPRFRLNEKGLPVFNFLKYKEPVDRGNGKLGGGFAFFDVEFVVPEDKLSQVRDFLQTRLNQTFAPAPPQVEFGTITYTKGTVSLNLESVGGDMVQRIWKAAKPSLFGRNISSFSVEFDPRGVTLFEQALQGLGGTVQVAYDLWFWAQLPPIVATVWFNASKFYSFYQQVDIDWNMWGDDSYRTKLSEQFIDAQAGGTDLHFDFVLPDPEEDKKFKSQIRDWATRTLEDMTEKHILEAIPPVSKDDQKVPDDIEHVTRDIQVYKAASFSQTFRENQAVAWNLSPVGTMPNITALTGPDGKPILWKDYSHIVDLDDPFFKQINVSISVNGDFDKLPIYSIDVLVSYHEGSTHTEKPYRFTHSDQVEKFVSFIENNKSTYSYSYQVNYKGSSKTFKSGQLEAQGNLTINVDDLGILVIDVQAVGVNWEQVSQAEVALKYQDTANGVPLIEAQFTFDKDHKVQRFEKVIFQPQRNDYEYSVKYYMADGKEFQGTGLNGSSQNLFINDPFSATKTISIRAIGDLDNDIDTIFVDGKYSDDINHYTQMKSIALSKKQPFFDWSFPVISETGGKVVYSGTIKFKSGTVEEIKETGTAKDTILLGERIEDRLIVEVSPVLIDFNEVKLVQLKLHYADDGNAVEVSKDLLLQKGATNSIWTVKLKDKTKTNYDWHATFFMADAVHSKRTASGQEHGSGSLILEVPAAG